MNEEKNLRWLGRLLNDMHDHIINPEIHELMTADTLKHLYPETDPDHIVNTCIKPYLTGNVEAEMNGEYWNQYNLHDPLESKPRCNGNPDLIPTFDKTDVGKEYKYLIEKANKYIDRFEALDELREFKEAYCNK